MIKNKNSRSPIPGPSEDNRTFLQKKFPELVITRPTSAYKILERVVTCIQADYKRLRMGTWCNFNPPPSMPASRCGTVACLAGWIGIITGRASDTGYMFPGSISPMLFGPESSGSRKLLEGFFSGDYYFAPDGTQEQAALAIQFLKGLMREYKRDLKARIVEPPTLPKRQTKAVL